MSSPEEVSATIAKSRELYLSWKDTSLDDRIDICTRWLSILEANIPEVTTELALQMGRYV
jgi:acyl-CoA reductase-like NAD-dependent aldehyde dehydrogenase